MITERDREIMRTLLDKVRVLSQSQIAATWWPGAERQAARRLRVLAAGGWLIGERLLARPLLPLEGPLFIWEPGDPAPDFGSLSWRAQSRWHSPAEPTPVWHAAPRAAARLGGRARERVKNPCQVTHDLHVSEIYLRFVRSADPRAAWWVGEDAVPRGTVGKFVPDALLLRGKHIVRAIEFGGAYPPARFAEFHRHCELLGLPYHAF